MARETIISRFFGNKKITKYPVPAIVVVGITGMMVEVLLIREFLCIFLGNELTLGIVLSGWLFSEVTGSALGDKFSNRWNHEKTIFYSQLLFAIFLPFSILLIRLSRYVLGVAFGEYYSFGDMLLSSLLFTFPLGFLHGLIFAGASRLLEGGGKAYLWETVGSMLGGILSTYVLLGRFPPYFFIYVILLMTIICLVFLGGRWIITLAFSYFLLLPLGNYTMEKKWNPQKLVFFKESIYGRIVVTEREGEKTIYLNGYPVLTYPHPDIPSLELFAIIPILSADKVKNILILGGGTGGLIHFISRLEGIERITCIELDRKVEEVSRRIWGRWGKKVLFVFDDARGYIEKEKRRFDVIYSTISTPGTFQEARFFTVEFFKSVKEKLTEKGVFALKLPSSFPYMVRYISQLNGSVISSLKDTFPHVFVFPGESENIIIASMKEIPTDPAFFTEKLKKTNIRTKYLSSAVINYRLSLIPWYFSSISRFPSPKSTDFKPYTLYFYLLYWTSQYSPSLEKILLKLGELKEKTFIFLGIFVFFLLPILKRSSKSNIYPIPMLFTLTTGMLSMILSLVILFMFQMHYGIVYSNVGIIMGLFMLGASIGSFIGLEIKGNIRSLLCSDLAVIITSALYILILKGIHSPQAFYIISFIYGIVTGIEFPLSSSILKKIHLEDYGTLYAFDLAGGAISGIFIAPFILPTLGIKTTIFYLVMLKLIVWIVTFFYQEGIS